MRESLPLFMTRSSVALALAYVLVSPAVSPTRAAPPPPLIGTATAIDGDTLDISGVRVRLEGIDAPEYAQTCGKGWLGRWSCGKAAMRALDRLVARHPVSCQERGHDKYQRILAVCFADGRDLNAELVRTGHAWAFVKYSKSYVEVEAEARALKIGIWKEDNVPAWTFREQQWAGAEQSAPKGCAIKGNVSRHGQIYHMPWNAFYHRVTIDADRGERWFCNEAEAVAAGWRPAGTSSSTSQ